MTDADTTEPDVDVEPPVEDVPEDDATADVGRRRSATT